MSKKLVLILTFALMAVPLAASALGLGEIKLNSALNQPLSADIPVVSAAPDEISSLHVKLASAAQFQQAGIPMSNSLSQLQFQVVPGTNGTASIHIISTQPFREPFLDMLVDVTWDNGELIREYTVFLNPPNFESATQPAAAPAPASATPVTSTPVTAAPTTSIAAPAAATVAKPAVVSPTAPAQAAVPPAGPPVAATSQAPLGGNYGPIHRGETLSEIALKLRPQGVTLNQMMIAIYRANPEVFMHNINLMKAGYVLRVPSADDIQAVQVADANAEVRTQITEWRQRRGLATAHPTTTTPTTEQPSLTLVAPSSAAQTAENQVPGAGKGGANATAASGVGSSAAASAASTAKAPITLASSGLAAVQAQASKENKQTAATKITPLAPEKPIVTKPLPKNKFKAPLVTQPAESGGLFSSLFNPYVIVLIIIVIVLILIGLIMRKRRNATPVSNKPIKLKARAPAADVTDWEKEEKAGLKDVTAAPAGGGRGQTATPAKTAAAASAATDTATMASTTATLNPETADPAAEADFHMAYGLYDQAAEVLKKGLVQDPGRRDLKMKLLEVYFTAGDRSNFVETARGLRQEMGATASQDWEKIAIMGRQVAADDPLFAGEATAPGASVDIPLESGGTGTALHTDLDPLAGAFEGVRPVVVPELTGAKPAEEDKHVLDFALPDLEPAPLKAKATGPATSTAAPSTAAKPKSGKAGVTTVTADFGTDSQVEFDKALKELSDFVNTNVPPQEEGTRSGAALSLAADAEVGTRSAGTATGTGTGTGTGAMAGEETTGLNEIGTKLDLARAYIDMGDAEGAKNILTEVIEEGDSQQKQEAQKLIQQLG